MGLLNALKQKSIGYGGYGLLRWIKDHFVDPQRAREFREREAFFGALIKPGDLCFDVGSNIGDISAVLLRLGARVVAIDPQPRAMHELKARLGAYPRLTCLETGLGAAPGEATLFLTEGVGTCSMVQDWLPGVAAKGSVKVPVTTLNAVIARHGRPAFCKIDVEGFELEVLKGLSGGLPLVSIEYHMTAEDLAKITQCLDRLGAFGPISLNLIPSDRAKFAWPDWLDRTEFDRRFPGELRDDPAFAYGDIFIRQS